MFVTDCFYEIYKHQHFFYVSISFAIIFLFILFYFFFKLRFYINFILIITIFTPICTCERDCQRCHHVCRSSYIALFICITCKYLRAAREISSVLIVLPSWNDVFIIIRCSSSIKGMLALNMYVAGPFSICATGEREREKERERERWEAY